MLGDTIYFVFLGIVQGITEFLPISSSGHLIILSYFIADHSLPLILNLSFHLGTLLAVLFYFRTDIYIMIKEFFKINKKNILFFIILATIPAGICGLLFQNYIGIYLHNPFVVMMSLIFVGIVMLFTNNEKASKSLKDLNASDAMIIGIFQAFALIPGISRSGSTIIAGHLLNFKMADSAKFSFLLSLPITSAAIILNANHIFNNINRIDFFLGILSSFITGVLVIKFFIKYLKTNKLVIFGYYRIFISIILFVLIFNKYD